MTKPVSFGRSPPSGNGKIIAVPFDDETFLVIRGLAIKHNRPIGRITESLVKAALAELETYEEQGGPMVGPSETATEKDLNNDRSP